MDSLKAQWRALSRPYKTVAVFLLVLAAFLLLSEEARNAFLGLDQ